MNLFRNTFRYLMTILMVLIFSPAKSHAYLDPGTGSYALQILLAAFFSSIFIVKKYWRRIRSFFVKNILRKKVDDTYEE